MATPSPVDDIFDVLHVAAWNPPDQARAFEAAVLAITAYDGHTRDQGTPYLTHPLAVVTVLRAELGVATPHTLLLGLLHDALEVTPALSPQVQDALGRPFAGQLRAMTPDHRLEQRRRRPGDEETWRAKTAQLPAESLLIRLADRIHNLRDLHHSPDPRRRERFVSALDGFYLPLAEDSRNRSPHLDTACTLLKAALAEHRRRTGQAARA